MACTVCGGVQFPTFSGYKVCPHFCSNLISSTLQRVKTCFDQLDWLLAIFTNWIGPPITRMGTRSWRSRKLSGLSRRWRSCIKRTPSSRWWHRVSNGLSRTRRSRLSISKSRSFSFDRNLHHEDTISAKSIFIIRISAWCHNLYVPSHKAKPNGFKSSNQRPVYHHTSSCSIDYLKGCRLNKHSHGREMIGRKWRTRTLVWRQGTLK